MTNLVERVYGWLSFVPRISLRNLLEIAIITFLVYEILVWIKNTRAWTLLKGIVVILGLHRICLCTAVGYDPLDHQ